MSASNHDRGVYDALVTFGLIKQAEITPASAAASVKNFLIGQPAEALNQIRSGKILTGEGLLARTLDPRVPGSRLATGVNLALNLGYPAYGLYRALQVPADSRGSAIGGTLGGAVGGLLGMPLGALGSLAGGTLGATLGAGLGRTFNQTSPHPEPRAAPKQAVPREAVPREAVPREAVRHRSTNAPSTGRPVSDEMSEITGRPTKFER